MLGSHLARLLVGRDAHQRTGDGKVDARHLANVEYRPLSRHARGSTSGRVATALAVAAIAAACSPSAGEQATPGPEGTTADSSQRASAAEATQTSEGGQVTVVARWDGTASGAVFHVQADTHSVDLDPLDLRDAVLRNNRGETLSATSWAAPKGGHHREGLLAFTGDAEQFLAGASWIELVMWDVGDLPERVFRWEVAA